MSPRQRASNPSFGDDEKIGSDVSSMAMAAGDGRRDYGDETGPGDGGPLELMQFAIRRMHDHVDWVQELEVNAATASPATAVSDGVRARRNLVMDSLVTMAHVAHRFLRHGDPEVREAAELLTTGTACLIGRMYCSFGAAAGLMQ